MKNRKIGYLALNNVNVVRLLLIISEAVAFKYPVADMVAHCYTDLLL
jgi:hypothetical protein